MSNKNMRRAAYCGWDSTGCGWREPSTRWTCWRSRMTHVGSRQGWCMHELFLTPRPRFIAREIADYMSNQCLPSIECVLADRSHLQPFTRRKETNLRLLYRYSFILSTRCLLSQSYRDRRIPTTNLCCPRNSAKRLQTILEVRRGVASRNGLCR